MHLDNLIRVRDSLEDRLDILPDVCRILHPVLVVLNPSIQVVKLIDILELVVRAIKFLEKLITLLLIPLPGSLVVPETGQPVQSLAVGLLPQVAGTLHLAAKELGTLWLLGERGAFVQDRLERLPLLVQLVDHLFLPFNMFLGFSSAVAVDIPVCQSLLFLQPLDMRSELVCVVVTLPQRVCNGLGV